MSKKRIVLVLILACALFLGLTFRTGYLQIVKGDWLSTKAVDQQTREIPIEPKRGTIYDRNMKEIGVSVTKYTVWCKPVEGGFALYMLQVQSFHFLYHRLLYSTLRPHQQS